MTRGHQRASGDLTVLDVPLRFAAGETKGHAVNEPDGRIVGLSILAPTARRGW